jgi:hypothetical protein
MRLASVVLSLVLVGALSGSAFAQPALRPAKLFLMPVLNATPPASIDDIKHLLDEALVKTESHPFRTDCTVSSWSCSPGTVFISAAAISTINIDGIPANTPALRVIITTGETDEFGNSLTVDREYKPGAIPDHIQIAVHKGRAAKQTFGTLGGKKTETPAWLFNKAQSIKDSEDPAIGFVSRGISDSLSIELKIGEASFKTIKVNLNYQRWFVDMGGFLTFSTVSDQELVSEDAGAGLVKILKKRYQSKLVPGTGIVLDFHPANFPFLAAQFGIATSVDRNASYFLGAGIRLRQLGPNTLATFAIGLAATQAKRFPDVKIGDIRSSTSPTVTQGSNRYAFGPYLSLSLGFSFGGTDAPPPAKPTNN